MKNELICYKQMPVWTKDKLPQMFQEKHNTKVGTWGKLTVLKGKLKFYELTENSDVIAEHPDVNFVYHPAKCEMVNEGFSYVTTPIEPQEISVERILLANKIGGMPMIGVKKDLFLKIGGLSTALRSLEDYDFLLKLVQDPTFKACKVAEPLTYCTFHTKRSSVSTDTTNTQKAIDYIREHYVKTAEQEKNFAINAQYMLAYPHIMNLSRKAAFYYFEIFKLTKSIKQLVIAFVVLISPKLAINLKRFM